MDRIQAVFRVRAMVKLPAVARGEEFGLACFSAGSTVSSRGRKAARDGGFRGGTVARFPPHSSSGPPRRGVPGPYPEACALTLPQQGQVAYREGGSTESRCLPGRPGACSGPFHPGWAASLKGV